MSVARPAVINVSGKHRTIISQAFYEIRKGIIDIRLNSLYSQIRTFARIGSRLGNAGKCDYPELQTNAILPAKDIQASDGVAAHSPCNWPS